MTHIILPVTGMTCGGCVGSVEKALLRQAGVTTAKASLETATVDIDFDPAAVTRDGLVAVIQRAGFESA